MTGSRLLTAVVLAAVLALGGCEPSDRRPGLWLSGETTTPPADWSFTDAHREIALEVQTPYLIAHSVTIWCAQVDGELYVAARDPEEKNWPGWVANRPDVSLKIGDAVYEASLQTVSDDDLIGRIQQAYQDKYALDALSGDFPVRYWRVAS